jgi:hypothetical protein
MKPHAARTLAAIVLAAVAASTASAQEGDSVGADDPPPTAELAPAPATAADIGPLVDRVVSCARAEGAEVSAEDRAAVGEIGALLAQRLGGAIDAGPCSDAACVATLAATDCTTLGLALAAGVAAGPPPGAAPAGAATYADALGAKILACWSAETGAAPTADETTRVHAFTAALAGAFGAQTEGGGCTPNAAALAPCIAAIQAKSCADMAAYLDTESDGASFAAACDGLLDCGGGLPGE